MKAAWSPHPTNTRRMDIKTKHQHQQQQKFPNEDQIRLLPSPFSFFALLIFKTLMNTPEEKSNTEWASTRTPNPPGSSSPRPTRDALNEGRYFILDDWFACLGALYIASMIPHRLTLDDNRNWSFVSSISHWSFSWGGSTEGAWRLTSFNNWLVQVALSNSSYSVSHCLV